MTEIDLSQVVKPKSYLSQIIEIGLDPDYADLTLLQIIELDSAAAYVLKMRKSNPKNFCDQAEQCWGWTKNWINESTVNNETKIVCIGGAFIDDLPHVKSGYKYNVDHLVDHYREVVPEMNKGNIQHVQGKSEALPFEDEFADIVYCRNALDHVDNPVRTLQEMDRILKPDGKVFIAVYYNSTFLSEHESTVIDADFLSKCVFPLFDVDVTDFEDVPQQQTIDGRKTKFVYIVGNKKEGGKVLLNNWQVISVEKILENFHLGFLYMQNDEKKANKYFSEMLEYQPVFDADVWRQNFGREYLEGRIK